MNRVSNGRINLLNKQQPPDISKLFQMYDRIPANQCSTVRDPLSGIWNTNLLSDAFFSIENIQILQNGIRAGVYKRSNKQYVIGFQDCDSLKVVMRSVFLQHSKNLNTDIPEQIRELNKHVLDYCIYNVYSEAQGYMKYLHDVDTLPVPISLPMTSFVNPNTEQKMPNFL